MIPRWHILLGAIFSLVLWLIFPQTSYFYILLIFLSSVLIDIDHYAVAIIRNGSLSLKEALEYHRIMNIIEKNSKTKKPGDFHLLHTVEFHIIVLLLGYLWIGFLYIFIGMVFHSAVDIIDMTYNRKIYRREFFLFNYIRKSLYEGFGLSDAQGTSFLDIRRKAK